MRLAMAKRKPLLIGKRNARLLAKWTKSRKLGAAFRHLLRHRSVAAGKPELVARATMTDMAADEPFKRLWAVVDSASVTDYDERPSASICTR